MCQIALICMQGFMKDSWTLCLLPPAVSNAGPNTDVVLMISVIKPVSYWSEWLMCDPPSLAASPQSGVKGGKNRTKFPHKLTPAESCQLPVKLTNFLQVGVLLTTATESVAVFSTGDSFFFFFFNAVVFLCLFCLTTFWHTRPPSRSSQCHTFHV